MSVDAFLDPEEETIQDCEEEIEQAIAQQLDPEEPSDSDEEEEVIPKVPTTTALEALNILSHMRWQTSK